MEPSKGYFTKAPGNVITCPGCDLPINIVAKAINYEYSSSDFYMKIGHRGHISTVVMPLSAAAGMSVSTTTNILISKMQKFLSDSNADCASVWTSAFDILSTAGRV
jgi:hypothetical protein